MRRTRTIVQALIGAILVAGGMAALTPAAWASTIPVACGENDLVAAVNLANSTPAADTLTLASGCTYSMATSHGDAANGQEALPVITSSIEMIGPATITRSSGSSFRIAEVSATGGLTLTSVAVTNGSVSGDGGGILNHGVVTLTDSSLSGNTAGGNGGGLANVKTPSSPATVPAATFTRSPVSNNTALVGNGGGIYNGPNGTLTTIGAPGIPMLITGNTAIRLSIFGLSFGGNGGGIAAVNFTATSLTDTTVTTNQVTGFLGSPAGTAGGVYRQGGAMTTTTSPIIANTPNNCVGSVPAVPNCSG